MTQKILLLLLCPFLLISCQDELKYDSTIRIAYQGRVTDAAGNPIANLPVGVYISKDEDANGLNYLFAYDHDMISYTTTDGNGDYKMFFPQPKNQDNIVLFINQDIPGIAVNESYSKLVITNLRTENLTDYKIDFGVTQLYEVANSTTLQIDFTNTSGQSLTKLNTIGKVSESVIDYNFNLPPVDGVNAYIMTNYNVGKDQTVTLKYQTRSGNEAGVQVVSNHEVQIPIGTEPVIYQLNY
ncbi:hypothetical protein FMM05_06320 [Flavobacterium zepuense]|uniref:Lipoprotein n=1 Tax=Flavobacterium zepuense TaxID=2593302 RepID=A0A552V5T7_9FLAO|nr:hypothetical protein [Flavobacterium zepuense]TRW25833.1 hypothetical protein FMM05_06320 [Flavobacterium zepuense]